MDSLAEQIADRLAWNLESRKSVEVKLRTEVTGHDESVRDRSGALISDHYIETAVGRRYFESVATKGGAVTLHYENYGDGQRFAHVAYRPEGDKVQDQILVLNQYWMEDKSDRKQVPQPLLFEYVGREPLHKAILKAEYLGEGQVLGRPCRRFLFQQVRWAVPQDQVFWIDEATGVPLKVEAYRVGSAREEGEAQSVWTAEALEDVQGHPVVTRSSQTAYAQGKPFMGWSYRVESIEFDKDYPASQFWPTFQPGVMVLDSVANKAYQVPGGEAASAIGTAAASVGTATPGRPIEAAPPADWSGTLVFGAGVALLLVGAILWRRGR